jgi:nucleotide-binding universal stress UspA family protein
MYKKFDRILVPLDLSPTSLIALDHGVFLAKHLKSELMLVHVHETKNFTNILRGLLFKSASDEKQVIEGIEDKIKEIAENLTKTHGIKTSTRYLEGTVYNEILKEAKSWDANCIVLGTHGSKGVENFIGGSNTFRVVNAAKCPVITIHGESGRKGIRDLVLPLDSSRDTREKVDDAIYVAKNFGSTIHIVAVSTSNDDMVLNRLRIVSRQVQSYIEEDKIKCTNEFLTGKNLTTLTLDYARKIDADLIVIMTEQESSSGFLAGPYSQQMINQSNIPIMSVKPKDKDTEFVTPY